MVVNIPRHTTRRKNRANLSTHNAEVKAWRDKHSQFHTKTKYDFSLLTTTLQEDARNGR